MAPKAAKGDVLQQKSPAEFFADNRTIAGFDNVRRRCAPARRFRSPALPSTVMRQLFFPLLPAWVQPGKCLYTTIRELVENALDAAESISQLPDVDITMCAWGCSGHSLPVNRWVHAGCKLPQIPSVLLLAPYDPDAERRSARLG